MKYGEILKGWFDRTDGAYVKLVHKDRLDWESTVDMDKGISYYAYGDVGKKDLIKNAYGYGRTTLGAMAIPAKVTLKLSKDRSCTDNKTVWVATSSFDRHDLTPNQKLDVFLGLAIHEACHLKYTNFDVMKAREKEFTKIIHHLWNTIEDEMIETSLADDSPGFMNYLAYLKWYYFDLLYVEEEKKALAKKEAAEKSAKIDDDGSFIWDDEEEETKPKKLEDSSMLDRLLSITFKLVRYPKYLKDEDFTFLGKYIIDIKAILYPYPTNTSACMDAAIALWELFKKFYKEPPKGATSGAEGEGDGEGGSGDDKGTKGKPGGDSGDGEFGDTEIDEETDESGSGDIDKDLEESLKSGIAKILSEVTPDTKSPEADSTKSDKKLEDKDIASELRSDPVKAKILEGEVSTGELKDTFFIRVPENVPAYKTAYNEIKRFVPVIKRSLRDHGRDHKLTYKGMRSGVLDTAKIAEAYQGVSTVYERVGQVKSDKISVVLLIDESGSMGISKANSARQAAILLKEALSEIGYINLFIYGHSGDQTRSQSTEIYVYKEPGWDKRYNLGTVTARCQNRDGVAIYETAKRTRKFTNEPTLMFVISDGEPAAGGYYGSSAIEHTRQQVKKVEGMNMQVIQVCIETSYDPKRMFTNVLTLTNMNTLAKDLSVAINKAAKKLSRVVIS